jgi:hypothetical protein
MVEELYREIRVRWMLLIRNNGCSRCHPKRREKGEGDLVEYRENVYT